MENKSVTKISISQVNTWISCPAKWHGKYILKIKEPKKFSLVYGTTFGDVIDEDYKVKLFSEKNIPLPELTELFIAKLESEFPTIEIFDNQDSNKLNKVKDYSAKAINVFYKNISVFTKPTQVQPRLKLSFKENPLVLYAVPDVITVEEYIKDTKTSAKEWNQSKAESSIQLTAYSLLKCGIGKNINHECIYDILIKTKIPKTQQVRVIIDDQKRRNFLVFLNAIVKQIDSCLRDNNFPPSAYYRNDPLCSKKYCPVANECSRQNKINIKE